MWLDGNSPNVIRVQLTAVTSLTLDLGFSEIPLGLREGTRDAPSFELELSIILAGVFSAAFLKFVALGTPFPLQQKGKYAILT